MKCNQVISNVLKMVKGACGMALADNAWHLPFNYAAIAYL